MLNELTVMEVRTLIARLELTSNGTTQSWGHQSKNSDGALYPACGHRRAPKDGRRELGDSEPAFLTLRRRLEKYLAEANEPGVLRVRADAERELRLARRATQPQAGTAERGTLPWKREIANSDKNVTELARTNMISRQTVYNYRVRYREQRAA